MINLRVVVAYVFILCAIIGFMWIGFSPKGTPILTNLALHITQIVLAAEILKNEYNKLT